MKKMLTIVSLLLPLIGFAQNLFFTTNELFLEFGEELPYGEIHVYNPSDDDITVAFKLERICYLSDDITKIELTVGTLHLIPTNQTTTWGFPGGFDLIASGDSMPIKIEQSPVGIHGSTWDFIVFDINNLSNSDTLRFVIVEEECLVLTQSIPDNKAIVKIYPNPVKDICRLSYDSHEAMELVIINSLGLIEQVIHLGAIDKEAEVDLSVLPQGVYYYYLKGNEGRTKVSMLLSVD